MSASALSVNTSKPCRLQSHVPYPSWMACCTESSTETGSHFARKWDAKWDFWEGKAKHHLDARALRRHLRPA